MARQTRAERRARRQQQAEDGAPPQRALARQPQIRPPEPVKSEAAPRRLPGSGARRFIIESWGELRKVEWPTQSHVIQGTVVVLIACIVVGLYLWIADQAFKRLVQDVFLK